MSSLIIFAKSPNANVYINVIAHAANCAHIERVVFAWHEAEQASRQKVWNDIQEFLNKNESHVTCYCALNEIINKNNHEDTPVRRASLQEFIARWRVGRDFFDITGLPKEDMIAIVPVLLAHGVRRVRSFSTLIMPPRLLHEYGQNDYEWIDVDTAIDDFLGFFEAREGRRIVTILIGALCLALFTTIAIQHVDPVSWPRRVDIFVSLIGGFFALLMPAWYVIKLTKRHLRAWAKR